jgi:hypothetical protein
MQMKIMMSINMDMTAMEMVIVMKKVVKVMMLRWI